MNEKPLFPAATVILLRDGDNGLETLMLQRSANADFIAGSWVFPGGKVEEEELQQHDGDVLRAARASAVRETMEEAGLQLQDDELLFFSRWTAPVEAPKRYDTWFFIAAAPTGAVQVDGMEIDTHLWATPATALQRQQAGELQLMPPTCVSLAWLAQHNDCANALLAARAQTPFHFVPRIVMIEGGACALYGGDAGYDSQDAAVEGARHRFVMTGKDWRYECMLRSG